MAAGRRLAADGPARGGDERKLGLVGRSAPRSKAVGLQRDTSSSSGLGEAGRSEVREEDGWRHR
ncbi:hypothetical protein E2562_001365 [Oryza meyeriana var. granulata]|uniref:Uncharacterized protein n=1 Tax=Oryza meyeriana var. granulata TaxID=110450 RepID=A0A6G1DBT3_9ORYZ|nr:hypothetical protein E2562_001365 [Oryza meyeriana var. granulata]